MSFAQDSMSYRHSWRTMSIMPRKTPQVPWQAGCRATTTATAADGAQGRRSGWFSRAQQAQCVKYSLRPTWRLVGAIRLPSGHVSLSCHRGIAALFCGTASKGSVCIERVINKCRIVYVTNDYQFIDDVIAQINKRNLAESIVRIRRRKALLRE